MPRVLALFCRNKDRKLLMVLSVRIVLVKTFWKTYKALNKCKVVMFIIKAVKSLYYLILSLIQMNMYKTMKLL